MFLKRYSWSREKKILTQTFVRLQCQRSTHTVIAFSSSTKVFINPIRNVHSNIHFFSPKAHLWSSFFCLFQVVYVINSPLHTCVMQNRIVFFFSSPHINIFSFCFSEGLPLREVYVYVPTYRGNVVRYPVFLDCFARNNFSFLCYKLINEKRAIYIFEMYTNTVYR